MVVAKLVNTNLNDIGFPAAKNRKTHRRCDPKSHADDGTVRVRRSHSRQACVIIRSPRAVNVRKGPVKNRIGTNDRGRETFDGTPVVRTTMTSPSTGTSTTRAVVTAFRE